jgi:hypothetical protein
MSSPREPWCPSIGDASLATLRSMADALQIDQLKQYGYDYCYLNLLTVFGGRHADEQIESWAMQCTRKHLLWGEEFHAYCLAAWGQRPWDNEIQELAKSIQLTDRARLILSDLLSRGSVIASGFHWGAYRFIPFALGSLGIPVKVMLGEQGIDKYGSYFQFAAGDIDAMRARGVPESFGRVGTVGTQSEIDLLRELRSMKRNTTALFIPVDGMFTTANSRGTVEVSFAGVPLRVKANPARFAAALGVPLVSLFAWRTGAGEITVDVAEVIEADSSESFERSAMERLYRSLEQRVLACPEQWEGARTFHHLRKLTPAGKPAKAEAKDRNAVHFHLKQGGLSFDRSRVACIQMAGGGRAWIDSRTLRCFSGAPEVLDALRSPSAMAQLWREVKNSGQDRGPFLHFLAELHAEGLLKGATARGVRLPRTSSQTDVWPDKSVERKGGEMHESRTKQQTAARIESQGFVA